MSKASDILYLLEALTPKEAMELLDIDPNDSYNLKAKWKAAAMKHHPDKGGDPEKMKLVNQAYELLQKYTPSSTGDVQGFKARRQERQERDKKWSETMKVVLNLMLKDFDSGVYISYFEKHFNGKLIPDLQTYSDATWANILFTATSEDAKTVFTIKFQVYFANVDLGTSLGDGSTVSSFKVGVDNTLLHDRRKEKMAKRDWKFTSTDKVLAKPEDLFPAKKLKDVFSGKAKKRKKFSKKDFRLAVLKELKARDNAEWMYIPVDRSEILDRKKDPERVLIRIFRTTFNRVGTWQFHSLARYKDSEKLSVQFASIPETEKGLDWLIGFVKDLIKIKDTDKKVDYFDKKLKGFSKTKEYEELWETKMSRASELLETILNESPGDGSQLSKIILGKMYDVVRIVSAKNAPSFEKALKQRRIKFEKGVIDLSRSMHNGAMLFGFKLKHEDEVDDILHDELEIKNANPDSYSRDWSHAKLD